ncbi:phosphoribosylformylglycinamidine cyclo-ligase [Convivina intestini]|uniref:Phosphoribosylformylglycinamidine cyclo-ligase n=1 Tax=Convivina intestini TaxID=1505726 RepID=A0A2U1DF63_9LACO|nr:phosphoribosylformylglycinamidine cyclo-ligase [Convivina intestini]PVY86308.1 phosphoribosylformylglycinamidine cyclo-ligase [Convivina intestini]CAH1850927.1 Phosphoribosylformylglycinamidine cyclo-ligase [Convivina intestini]SDB82369.1 phosphoribosylformylglycinamidine cyclo-ligase [Leuconostocaceae bacterium R-53105]
MTQENAYQAAGVDIQAGQTAVQLMQAAVEDTFTPNVLNGLGGFGAMFSLGSDYRNPVLVAGADGVGTKLLLAIAAHKHDTIGQDLVAMVANDILAQGAKPAFMLDYLALDKMRPAVVAEIVTGIAQAAKATGMALIGGESAELPGLYAPHHYDLAAFAVGVAEEQELLQAQNVRAGDVLIGLPSTGLHSNGYSLVRSVLKLKTEADFQNLAPALQESLLKPTALYSSAVWPLINQHLVTGIAHITGGGLVENLPRAYGDNLTAQLNWGTWPIPTIFHTVQSAGELSLQDMLLTFNNGLGMVLIVKKQQVEEVLHNLTESQQTAYVIGEMVPKKHERVTWSGVAPW